MKYIRLECSYDTAPILFILQQVEKFRILKVWYKAV